MSNAIARTGISAVANRIMIKVIRNNKTIGEPSAFFWVGHTRYARTLMKLSIHLKMLNGTPHRRGDENSLENTTIEDEIKH